MLTINTQEPFRASWHPQHAHLDVDAQGPFLYVAYKIKYFILYIPNTIVACCINPRRATVFAPFSETDKIDGFQFRHFRKEIMTPDGVSLTADVQLNGDDPSKNPTVILFNPVGANHFIHGSLTTELIRAGCNVVKFDYRGLGDTWQKEDLEIDGESVYQYVTQELGMHEDQVHLYGFSLGGAVSLQVKGLHPENAGKYVGDRSFKSLFDLITETLCIAQLGLCVKKVTMAISSILIAYPIYLLGWEWDGNRVVDQIQGEKLFIYHPNDVLIPFEASLAKDKPNSEVIRLNPEETGAQTHFGTLDNQRLEGRGSALKPVVAFLAGHSIDS